MTYPPGPLTNDTVPGDGSGDSIDADHINDIVTELGTNPKGVAANVQARLDAMEATPPASSALAGFAIPVCSADAPQAWKDWTTAYGTAIGVSLVCDGTADDVQIQAAIDHAYNVVGSDLGGLVALSPGTFWLADNTPVIHKNRVRVVGAGHGSTIVRPEDPSAWTAVLFDRPGNTNSVTWGRPLWDMYLDDADGKGPAELSHLTLHGGGDNAGGRLCGLRVYQEGGNSHDHPISGPDIMHLVHHIAVSQVTDVGVWVPGHTTGGSSSNDTQACHFHDIRVFHTGGHGFCMGGADGYFSSIDVGSTGNRNWGQDAYGIMVDGGNHHIWHSKAWYSKRAGVTGPSLSGVGWHLNTTRCLLNHVEAQEQANHGFYFRLYRGNATGLMAHSSGTDFSGGRDPQSDAAGIAMHQGVGDIFLTGYCFNQGPASKDSMRWGFYHEGTLPNSMIQVAWYSEENGELVNNYGNDGTAFGSSAGYWIGGGTVDTQEEPLRSNIVSGGAGSEVTFWRGNGNTVTGTTLTDDDKLIATLEGGQNWYEYEAFLIYNADTTTHGQVAVRIERDGGSGSAEQNTEIRYLDLTEAIAVNDQDVFQDHGVVSTQVFGAGSLTEGTPTADRRVARVRGVCYIGGSVTTATLAIQFAEGTGTGTGMTLNSPSFLKVSPINGGLAQ